METIRIDDPKPRVDLMPKRRLSVGEDVYDAFRDRFSRIYSKVRKEFSKELKRKIEEFLGSVQFTSGKLLGIGVFSINHRSNFTYSAAILYFAHGWWCE